MSREILEHHRRVWFEKAVLRAIYQEWYDRMMGETVLGRVLEIGSGPGSLRTLYPEVITSDMIFCPWNKLGLEAAQLPFRNDAIGNIMMTDVLHHLPEGDIPRFFDEAVRVLRRGGRIILLEPFISPLSFLVYSLFHHEPVRMDVGILGEKRNTTAVVSKNPFDANQAIPTILFGRERSKFEQRYPMLRIRKLDLLSFIAYPLSGGFSRPGVIGESGLRVVRGFERLLYPFRRLLAFRVLVVLELVELAFPQRQQG